MVTTEARPKAIFTVLDQALVGVGGHAVPSAPHSAPQFVGPVTDGSSDGGELFVLACGVWLACATLLWIRRSTWMLMLAHLAARQAQR